MLENKDFEEYNCRTTCFWRYCDEWKLIGNLISFYAFIRNSNIFRVVRNSPNETFSSRWIGNALKLDDAVRLNGLLDPRFHSHRLFLLVYLTSKVFPIWPTVLKDLEQRIRTQIHHTSWILHCCRLKICLLLIHLGHITNINENEKLFKQIRSISTHKGIINSVNSIKISYLEKIILQLHVSISLRIYVRHVC